MTTIHQGHLCYTKPRTYVHVPHNGVPLVEEVIMTADQEQAPDNSRQFSMWYSQHSQACCYCVEPLYSVVFYCVPYLLAARTPLHHCRNIYGNWWLDTPKAVYTYNWSFPSGVSTGSVAPPNKSSNGSYGVVG